MATIDTTADVVRALYAKMRERLDTIRKRLGRPLTLTEKVVLGHCDDPVHQELQPGTSFLALRPDRVAMQDATAQMAILQFMQAGRTATAVPTTVHCDHLIRAQTGAAADMTVALTENQEVYDFLRTASQKYGIGFWGPGSGIIHQVVLEQYAFPGGLMIGTDSHTPNAGGLGMIACGVGGADAVDVMAGFPWEVLYPKIIGVHLTGALNGWTASKDVILKVCEILTTKGGTNRIIEYFGPGTRGISCTGKGTITNMGAELGATTSIFPYDAQMAAYLRATERGALADLADAQADLLTADADVEKNPQTYFDQVIDMDLSQLEPHIVGPHSPDVARPISRLKQDVTKEHYPDTITNALIGSCTNSSYEDIERAADVARQATRLGLKAATRLMVTPGSEQVFQTIQRDGQMAALEAIGAMVLANACGPCIGQWKRDDVKPGDRNTILTSYNRNFPRRNDGSAETLAFIGSPEIVVAMSLAGRLSFDPLHDALTTPGGKNVRLAPPKKADPLPKRGFVRAKAGYLAPADDPGQVTVAVAKQSQRLEILAPFPVWDGNDFVELPILIKTQGKCTTDHISPAGPWLRYRGHLDKISDNMFLGATNAFTGESGKQDGKTFAAIARAHKAAGQRWIVIGDENYGEGSSREHAAMSPRHLGCAAVIVRSFARIHETNLKKQGILPLTFAESSDYDKVRAGDRISITGLNDLTPSHDVAVTIHHTDATTDAIHCHHSCSVEQIKWFRAGAALNLYH